MVSFSTDNIRPRDRFDHWREERSKALFARATRKIFRKFFR
jgi:hypothetical protein